MFGKIMNGFKILYSSFKILLSIIATLSIMIIYNPSGYSYYDFVKNSSFEFTPYYLIIYVLPGILLFIFVILDLPSAWRAARNNGKTAFFIIFLFSGLLLVSTGAHKNIENVIWYLELSLIIFIVFGGYVNYRNKRKFSTYSVEEQNSPETES